MRSVHWYQRYAIATFRWNPQLRAMLTRLVLYLFVALTLQMAWNARLRTATGSPILTTIISVVITLVALAPLWISGMGGRGTVPAFNSLPKWAWFGGVCAIFYLVASLIAIPKIGAAAVISLVIAGQMVAALILDSTGGFGVTQISLSLSRVLGTALLLAGVILIQRR